jgi:hypothetical protein
VNERAKKARCQARKLQQTLKCGLLEECTASRTPRPRLLPTDEQKAYQVRGTSCCTAGNINQLNEQR